MADKTYFNMNEIAKRNTPIEGEIQIEDIDGEIVTLPVILHPLISDIDNKSFRYHILVDLKVHQVKVKFSKTVQMTVKSENARTHRAELVATVSGAAVSFSDAEKEDK